MSARENVLILWNQVEEDIYERWRAEGPRPLPWNPDQNVPDVGTVAEEMAALVQGVRRCGYNVQVVNIEDDLDRIISAVRLYRPDAIMNLVEYFNDDASLEAHVAGLFELLDVPYTGNRPQALGTCQNKHRTKILLEAAGVPTARHRLVERLPLAPDHGLTFPVIVKPVLEDASGGIEVESVVRDHAALEERILRVLQDYQMPALIEEYIHGREIHASILGNDPPVVLPLFEMEFDEPETHGTDVEATPGWQPRIISYRAKWDPHSPEFYSMDSICPARNLAPSTQARIRRIAVAAFRAVGCRDYARIDMRLAEDGSVYVLEVNPNPDLTDGAAFMQCAVASGRTYSRALGDIVELAIERGRRQRRVEASQPDLPSDHLLREWVTGKRPSAPVLSAQPDQGHETAAAIAAAAETIAIAEQEPDGDTSYDMPTTSRRSRRR